MKTAAICGVALLLGGCIGHGSWGGAWPTSGSFAQAARDAATDPQTWVPLATAGVLLAADVDDKWSADLAADKHFFDDSGEELSSELLDVLAGVYVATALIAPSPTVGAKLKGLTVGAGTLMVESALSDGLKRIIRRERPSTTNDRSMPSGHASRASAIATMAGRNMDYIDAPQWSRQVTAWSLHGVALGVGFARIEAEKHHLSDVFVGYALGNFLASFMYGAFLESSGSQAMISFQALQDGGALTLQVPLR